MGMGGGTLQGRWGRLGVKTKHWGGAVRTRHRGGGGTGGSGRQCGFLFKDLQRT